jgi:catalase
LTTSFSQYLSDYAAYLRYSNGRRHSFAIETLDGRHIGNCLKADKAYGKGVAGALGIKLSEVPK